MVGVSLPKHQKVGEVENVPREIFHIRSECFSSSPLFKATKSDSFDNAVQYEAVSDRLEIWWSTKF